VSASDTHKLVVLAPNYVAQTISLTGATGEKKHFDLTLVKSDPRAIAAAAATANPSAGGSGKLNVGARGGWCNVSVDGAARGPTPVAGIVLSAGNHTVTCMPEGGKAMSTSVNITADNISRYTFTIPQ
jgi:serine/threonine-protein kinase